MRLVLGIASVLGLVGPIASFGLFYLGDRVFHLNRPHLQPMRHLMLSVAGHLTIFLSRTRGPFCSIRPAKILWMAVLGTEIIATFIAVYGFLMPPLGWGWAGFVWAYALVWFLVSDRVKLLAHLILDPATAKTASNLAPQIAKRAYELSPLLGGCRRTIGFSISCATPQVEIITPAGTGRKIIATDNEGLK
jgi:H+-transporting ATPase